MLPRPPSPNPPYAAGYSAASTPVPAHYDRKQKQRGIMGITAGAEDVKYQAKYRELKKKVKEIESDNDRLYFKLLLAKKNIRRMNLERAILYERLAAVPPTPGRRTQELPAEQDPMFHPQPPAPSEHSRVIDPNDREVSEYLRTHPTARLITAPDGRVVAIEETPTVDARGVAVPTGQPPPHGVPLVHGFRHDSGPGFDPGRQLPPPPPMIPLLVQTLEAPPKEPAAPNDHQAYQHAQSRPPPTHQTHSHSSSSHHSRSSSARPDIDPAAGGTSRMDIPGGSYSVHSRSPNIPSEPQAGYRSRRHDGPGHPNQHSSQLPPPHIQIPQENVPSSPPMVSPSAHSHSGSRLHNHQRIGPGAHIHRERSERDWEIQQELEFQRAIEREREEQRAIELRHRLAEEEREDEALFAQEEARVRAGVLSGSGSPGPAFRGAGGSRDASRPTSGQAHETERPPRAYASHHLGSERDHRYPNDDPGLGPAPRDGALPAEGPHGSGGDSRKRLRDEMEIDDRYEGEPRAVNEGGAASRGTANTNGNRGARRTHTDEDGDTGHPAAGKGDDLPDERMEEDA
ncbi:hypothetical protein C2E23DRAFT_759619 [Lenzites betulinus]|nr:hypothetical protein C2E23DRAFT_759619 [Lenzites betulinus]